MKLLVILGFIAYMLVAGIDFYIKEKVLRWETDNAAVSCIFWPATAPIMIGYHYAQQVHWVNLLRYEKDNKK